MNSSQEFYVAFYSEQELLFDPGYLKEVNTSKLSEEEKEELDAPLSIEEIKTAMMSLNNNKGPGTDGLPIEVYKACLDLFADTSTLSGGYCK